jgi:hypothetical protein
VVNVVISSLLEEVGHNFEPGYFLESGNAGLGGSGKLFMLRTFCIRLASNSTNSSLLSSRRPGSSQFSRYKIAWSGGAWPMKKAVPSLVERNATARYGKRPHTKATKFLKTISPAKLLT